MNKKSREPIMNEIGIVFYHGNHFWVIVEQLEESTWLCREVYTEQNEGDAFHRFIRDDEWIERITENLNYSFFLSAMSGRVTGEIDENDTRVMGRISQKGLDNFEDALNAHIAKL